MNYKKIITIFLFTFIFQSFLFSVVLAEDVTFTPSVPIPGVSAGWEDEIIASDFSTLTKYIADFYKLAIGLTGILAVIMVTAGGMVWLTAGGSATQIGKAKQMIMGSIAGLLLALFSYTLLYSINPDIVSMKIASVESVLGKNMEGCKWQVGECNSISQKEASYGNYCGSKPKTAEGVIDPEMKYCCCIAEQQKTVNTGDVCFLNNDDDCEDGFICNMFWRCAGDGNDSIGGCCDSHGIGGQKCDEPKDCEVGYTCVDYACSNLDGDDNCTRCGEGFWNVCDEEECKSLGEDCVYGFQSGKVFGHGFCVSK